MSKEKQPVQPEQAQLPAQPPLPELDPAALPGADNGDNPAEDNADTGKKRSMGRVVVMQVISAGVVRNFVKAAGGDPNSSALETLNEIDELLMPVPDVPELTGVPEAQKWLKEAMESQDVGEGSYVIVRLAKRIDATVKRTLSVNFAETDF